MSGHVNESVAAYIQYGSGGQTHLTSMENGSSFVYSTTGIGPGWWKNLCTPTATMYPFDSDHINNKYYSYDAYQKEGYGYGDAILETSRNSTSPDEWSKNSWFGRHANYPIPGFNFFMRRLHWHVFIR